MAALLLAGLVVLIGLGMPVAFALGVSTLSVLLLRGDIPLAVVGQRVFAGLDSFPLMAIPLFVLAGNLMDQGGISKRIIALANALVGWITASLAMVSILAMMLISGVSGSGTADTVAVGSITIPAMTKRGYNRDFATALMAAAGALGPIIPPSLIMVFMGIVNNVSIGGLFLAGVVPGILIGLALMGAAYLHARGAGAAYLIREPFRLDTLVWTSISASPALVMPLIIIGGILSGAFTATEAAVIAVVYGLLIGWLVYRELKLAMLPRILITSALQSGMVMLIVGTANLFAWLVAVEQVPVAVGRVVTALSSNAVVFMALVNVLFLVVGMFMEGIAAIIVLMPVLLPIARSFGIDPLHFSLVASVNLSIGLATPPYGSTLFAATMLSGRSIRQVTPHVYPLVAAMLAVLGLITYVPEIPLLLPRLLMGYRPVGE